MSAQRPIRKAIKHRHPELSEAQKRRLRDAHADGVKRDDIKRRFNVTEETIREVLAQ